MSDMVPATELVKTVPKRTSRRLGRLGLSILLAGAFVLLSSGTVLLSPALASASNGPWSNSKLAFLPSGGSNGYLNAISCTSSTSCVAVGYYENSSSGDYVPLAETLSNGIWSAPSSQQPPTPSGGSNGYLNAISCTSSSCVAVGYYENSSSGDYVPLAESLSKSGWILDTLAFLPSGGSNGYLNAISCTSSTSCVAVGYYEKSSSDNVPLAESLSGTTWSAPSEQPPLPSGVTSKFSVLNAISCTS